MTQQTSPLTTAAAASQTIVDQLRAARQFVRSIPTALELELAGLQSDRAEATARMAELAGLAALELGTLAADLAALAAGIAPSLAVPAVEPSAPLPQDTARAEHDTPPWGADGIPSDRLAGWTEAPAPVGAHTAEEWDGMPIGAPQASATANGAPEPAKASTNGRKPATGRRKPSAGK